jgi:hypothetical protein
MCVCLPLEQNVIPIFLIEMCIRPSSYLPVCGVFYADACARRSINDNNDNNDDIITRFQFEDQVCISTTLR